MRTKESDVPRAKGAPVQAVPWQAPEATCGHPLLVLRGEGPAALRLDTCCVSCLCSSEPPALTLRTQSWGTRPRLLGSGRGSLPPGEQDRMPRRSQLGPADVPATACTAGSSREMTGRATVPGSAGVSQHPPPSFCFAVGTVHALGVAKPCPRSQSCRVPQGRTPALRFAQNLQTPRFPSRAGQGRAHEGLHCPRLPPRHVAAAQSHTPGPLSALWLRVCSGAGLAFLG